MKIITSFLLFAFFASHSASASFTDSIPSSKNLTRVTLMNGSFLKGYIINVTDTGVGFLTRKDYQRMRFMQIQTIPVENIEGITRNFNTGFTAGKGALYGFLLGFGAGFILGLARPDDCKDAYGNTIKCSIADRLFATKNFGASFIAGGCLGSAGLVLGIFSPKKQKAYYSIKGNRKNLKENKTGIGFQQD
jgi:hypothetical protein